MHLLSGALLTVPEAAERLKCCNKTVLARIRSGELAATSVGHAWLIPEAALEAFLERRLVGGAVRPPRRGAGVK